MRAAAITFLVLLAACGEGHPPLPAGARIARGKGLKVPAFHLLERAGVPVDRESLQGKVWVAAFIFTRCTTTCIPMCAEMTKLQEEFRDEPDFRIVATTVDPAYDTREVLARFAKGYGADPGKWLFLTGKRDAIREFAHEGLKIQWHPTDPLIHSTYFVLIDRHGTIRDYFNQTDKDAMKRLRGVVRHVLAEKAP
ncbi:MAG: SCO family protein [Planctomycetota bacterium]|jgi:cytochrome oxidase Cu insertion factor (SCO1/SenC/PrrC family)